MANPLAATHYCDPFLSSCSWFSISHVTSTARGRIRPSHVYIISWISYKFDWFLVMVYKKLMHRWCHHRHFFSSLLYKTNRHHVGLFSYGKICYEYQWHIRLNLVCHFFVFTTFWCQLCSVTEQTHGKMKSTCWAFKLFVSLNLWDVPWN